MNVPTYIKIPLFVLDHRAEIQNTGYLWTVNFPKLCVESAKRDSQLFLSRGDKQVAAERSDNGRAWCRTRPPLEEPSYHTDLTVEIGNAKNIRLNPCHYYS